MYEGVVQTGSLADYVEKWQALMVAVRASGIKRTDQDHVIQFVTGLARMEDRKSILDQDPETLEDAYRAATRIRHYSLLAHDYSRTVDTEPSTQEEDSQLKILKGADKLRAYRDGLCLGCGKKGHFLDNCEESKKPLKVLKQFRDAAIQLGGLKNGILKGGSRPTGMDEGSGTDYESGSNLGDSKSESGTDIGGEEQTKEVTRTKSPGPRGRDRGK